VPLKGNFRLYFVHDPNTDGDSLFDSADDCDGEHGGPFGIQGCPDSDRDRIRDRDDACDSEDARRGRDRNDNGCPDRERLNPRVVLDPASFCPRGVCVGIKVEVLVVSGVPRGSRVDVSCTRRACRRTSKVKRSKPIRLLRGKRLRAGVKVTVRVTKAGAVGRYFSYSIKKNNLRKTGEKRPLCLTSRKARPKRCTERQLIR
jgi:hypothetical protein